MTEVPKIAFSGKRDYTPADKDITRAFRLMAEILSSGACVPIVGCANGVDAAVRRVFDIHRASPFCYEADWNRHGRAAGPKRNKAMIDDADGLVAFWDGKSRGTANAIWCATNKGIPVLILPVEHPEPIGEEG